MRNVFLPWHRVWTPDIVHRNPHFRDQNSYSEMKSFVEVTIRVADPEPVGSGVFCLDPDPVFIFFWIRIRFRFSNFS